MSPPLLWHPNARRVIIPSAPQNLAFQAGGRKHCWHTTEGSSIEGAISAYRANGVCPHFTISVHGGTRDLVQHLPMNVAASALEHPAGTPVTNTAGVNIQTEAVGFAADAGSWPDAMYRYLHLLARFVQRHAGVPLTEGVVWRVAERRIEPHAFIAYSGHYGHRHAPNQRQHHQDPGDRFHITRVLKGD